jgi:UTP:GlnB (protein PII) uridylyltransferase
MIGAAAAVLLAAPVQAQVRSEIELTRQQIQTDRQAIVAAGLQLTDEQAAAFWPVYREYRTALDPIGDRQVALLTDFAEKYQAMTEADTDRMLKEMFAIQDARLDVAKKYVDRFKKVLPTVMVGRFYQIENKLDAIIMFDLAAGVPLLTP